MSDLQCAATLLLTRDGAAAQARGLGRSLRGARLAAIYTKDLSAAVQTAEIVGAETGVPVSIRQGPRDWSVDELESIADLHRGETVLVVSHSGAAAGLLLASGAVLEVAVDADGWQLVTRADE
jgi:broad specificity phosphatase PhoE